MKNVILIGYYALFNDLIDLFIAGMETTASSLMWTLLFFLHHPEVQEKVQHEIDEVRKTTITADEQQ